MSLRSFRNHTTTKTTFFPELHGKNGACATMHNLSAMAAYDILSAGGNAVDAMVSAVLVEGVVNPQMHTIGGECPILIKMSSQDRVVAINGNTAAPELATARFYKENGFSEMPDTGILAAGVPATLSSLLLALSHFGTMKFCEVSHASLSHAKSGFPLHRGLLKQEKFGVIDLYKKFVKDWHTSAKIYLPNGRIPTEGTLIRNEALADLFENLNLIEQSFIGSRRDKISAVHEEFYKGFVAGTIDNYSKKRNGLIRKSDLEVYSAQIEEPSQFSYMGNTIYKCGFWTQGPASLQAIAILKNFELENFEHNSVEYLHFLIEAIKLAYADREQYYGDGSDIPVPEKELLSEEYGRRRAALIIKNSVISDLQPGNPKELQAKIALSNVFEPKQWGHGTVHVDVADKKGNIAAATPSGAWLRNSEIIPELGFPLGNRLMTFYLGPKNHPNRVSPFKRPRTTISPSLLLQPNGSEIAFGSMGGDQQEQWQLQFLLNIVVFDMTIQEAIEAPKISSEHFPGFFAPHDRTPNFVRAENRIPKSITDELALKGHIIERATDWTEGYILSVAKNGKTGTLQSGCDPRSSKSEIFPATALCW